MASCTKFLWKRILSADLPQSLTRFEWQDYELDNTGYIYKSDNGESSWEACEFDEYLW